MLDMAYALVDREGRLVTDRQGYVRIWESKKAAALDARELSRILGVKVRPKAFQLSYLRWMRQVPKSERIEW